MKIHFVGIGGIGLSAIAKFMAKGGHTISGSDIRHTKITAELEHLGIKVTVPHSADAIDDQEIVIYTAAASSDNVELIEARAQNKQVLSRKDALALVLQDKKVYSVCGAHGKSTTTAIMAEILDSNALIGAISKAFGSNAKAVDSDIMAFEADESDGSFCFSNPYCAIITNAEPEHMEYYNYDLENFHNHYRRFLDMASIRVFNAEDEFLSTLDIDAIRLYPSLDITNIRFELQNGEPTTTFNLKDLGEFSVWGFGAHIALDASLAILAALNELDLEKIRTNIAKYKGLKKRFDILAAHSTYALIDDYAHHPTEIEATMQSVKLYSKLANINGITAIWQPHKYSRLCDNLDHFTKCFEGVDRLIILPVWAVNESPRDVDFKGLFAKYTPMMATHLHKNGDDVIIFCEDGSKLELNSGIVIGFGAGDITYQLRGEIITPPPNNLKL